MCLSSRRRRNGDGAGWRNRFPAPARARAGAPHIHPCRLPSTLLSLVPSSHSLPAGLHTTPPMRYIRFLKTPRVVADRKTGKSDVYCLITITSDLGDSFLPYHVELSAELLSAKAPEQPLIWRTVHWTSGTRSLPVTFPLPKALASSSLRLRVGVEPKARHDGYEQLSDDGHRGIVSAWSAEFSVSVEAVRLVERRFTVARDQQLSIWEETGESIARHLW